MGLGVWAHRSTGWSLTTAQERGSEEAVMAGREPHTPKALDISGFLEPSRRSPAGVAQADAAVVRLTQRSTARASHRGLTGRETMVQPGGRRAASCPRCRPRALPES